jgi:hypothetical protein
MTSWILNLTQRFESLICGTQYEIGRSISIGGTVTLALFYVTLTLYLGMKEFCSTAKRQYMERAHLGADRMQPGKILSVRDFDKG